MGSSHSIVLELPVVLCAETHRSLGYVQRQQTEPIELPLFAPIASFEFPNIAKHYPILFFNDDAVFPVAITGQVGSGGAVYAPNPTNMQPYLPGVMQLYPFMLEKLPDQDAGVLIFDQKSAQLTPLTENHSAAALFNDAGAPTETLHQIASFAAQLFDGRRRAAAFALALKAAGVLTPSLLEFNEMEPAGLKQHRLYMINEPAYRALPKDTVHDWFLKGWLDLASLVLVTQRHWLNYRHHAEAPARATGS
ncbi:hypothetical protein QBD01_001464 [Ochrobactrum sp. 19YEA23]|uniref:SapC family protein n=1 Tax=Ochrobactrum sp. 19YEA23 TaxID=3039854 RepID=UPI0024790E84|nr:hypothetical protein [Ochrobactrum sp. 19YEA23]